MAVNETITLNGVPQVVEKLAQVQAETVKTSQAINAIGAEAAGGAAIQNFFVTQMGQASQSMERVASSGVNLRLATRALKPILGDLGVSMGGLTGLTRLAAASLPLFAAVFAGKTLIDLTKFNEQLAITKDRLDVITKGPGAFQQVAQDAARLGVPIGTLATAVESFATAWQRAAALTSTVKFVGDVPPGSLQNLQHAQEFATALVAQFRAAGLSSDDAAKATKEFGDQLGKTGTITGDMVRKLAEASPRVAENLAKMFSGTSIESFARQLDKVPLSLNKINLVTSTFKFTQFADPKPITALTGELINLGKSFEGLKAKIAPAADAISTFLVHELNLALQNASKASAGDWLNFLLNPLKGIGSFISSQVDFSALGRKLAEAFKAIDWKTLAVDVGNLIIAGFGAALDKTIELAKSWLKAIQDIIDKLRNIDWSGWIKSFEDALEILVTKAKSAFDKIRDAAKKVQEQGLGEPGAELGIPANNIDKFVKDVDRDIKQLGIDGQATWATVGTQMRSALDSGPAQTFGDAVNRLLKDIATNADNAAKKIKNINDTFTAGFTPGARAPAGAKGAFVTPPGGELPDAIKAAQDAAARAGGGGGTTTLNLPSVTDINATADAVRQLEAALKGIDTSLGQSTLTTSVATIRQSLTGVADDMSDVNSDVAELADGLTRASNTSFSQLDIQVSDILSTLQQVGQMSFNAAISSAQQLAAALNSAADAAQRLSNASTSSSFAIPLAGGGLVSGPGTGTSDSVLARISSGEFIMTAAATRHWGASFLSALNSLIMPMMPRSTLIPRFAEGGPVSASPAAVHLHLSGESFALQASEGVATALRRHAVRSRLVSTGRKPSWY